MTRLLRRTISGTSRRAPLALLVAVLAAAGCGFFSLGQDTVTLRLDSEPPTAVRLITSNDFAIALDENGLEVFHLFQADTAWVELPFRKEYDLRATGMFYARAAEAEEPETSVTFRVAVDGDETFARDAVLVGVGTQYYYFTS